MGINLFIKKNAGSADLESDVKPPKIFYARADEFWRKEEKYHYLNSKEHCQNIDWQQITPDRRHTWLTEGLQPEFDAFIPMGSKAVRDASVNVIFKIYSLGVSTNRDTWTYNFNQHALNENMQQMIETYNADTARWTQQTNPDISVDDFVTSDEAKIKWSSGLKNKLKSGKPADFSPDKIRVSFYRSFTKSNLYFDRMMNERVREFPFIFPTPETETENLVICVPSIGGRSDFWCYLTNVIPNLTITSIDGNQCFPFYTYDEDGTNRQENITDWH